MNPNFVKCYMIVLMLLFINNCNVISEEMEIGTYKNNKIVTKNKELFEIITTIQMNSIELSEFKNKYSKEYNEIVHDVKKISIYESLKEKTTKKSKKEITEMFNIILDIQNIYITEKSSYEKLLSDVSTKDIDFGKYVKKYSIETNLSQNGVKNNITVKSKMITPELFYRLSRYKKGDIAFEKDIYGYHVVKILDKRKVPTEIQPSEADIQEYVEWKYFDELCKKYKVQINYANISNINFHAEEKELFRIDNVIYTKNVFFTKDVEKNYLRVAYIEAITKKKGQEILFEIVKLQLVDKEAFRVKDSKDIFVKADQVFKNSITQLWFNSVFSEIKVDLTEEYLTKRYKEEPNPTVPFVKFSYFTVYDKVLAEKMKKIIENEKNKDNVIKLYKERYQETDYISKSNSDQTSNIFIPYLNSPVGQVLPILGDDNIFIVAFVKDVKYEKELSYKDFKNYYIIIYKQNIFIQNIRKYWDENKDLKIEKWVYTLMDDTLKYYEKILK